MERPSILKRILRVVLTLVAGGVLALVAALVAFARHGEQPHPWQTMRPESELSSGNREEVHDFAGYLALEDRLFAETRDALAREVPTFPGFSRYDAASPTSPTRFDRDWNRTYELSPEGAPRGEALLLHGLSDSPYSLRAVGQLLAANGFHVVGLRLPGHGTVPGSLAVATRDDWRAAVRIGVGATGGRPDAADREFVMVGYSNGAALSLDYALTVLQDGGGRLPDRLVFLSPAVAVTPAAALARWQQRVSDLPGLGKLAWVPMEVEFDPFKYNSFPAGAGAEIHDLTSEIEERLVGLDADTAKSIPPVLTLQSVVDATIPPVASLTRLYSRVRPSEPPSELVLFDVNRLPQIRDLLGPSVDELRSLPGAHEARDFRITLITNERTGSPRVSELSKAPGSLEMVEAPLELEWPPGVYSLTHIAIPFPPDDPAYGGGASSLGPPFPFGALDLKGERGVFRIPDGLLTRFRYNPFFPLVERKILEFLALREPTTTPATADAVPNAAPQAASATP